MPFLDNYIFVLVNPSKRNHPQQLLMKAFAREYSTSYKIAFNLQIRCHCSKHLQRICSSKWSLSHSIIINHSCSFLGMLNKRWSLFFLLLHTRPLSRSRESSTLYLWKWTFKCYFTNCYVVFLYIHYSNTMVYTCHGNPVTFIKVS